MKLLDKIPVPPNLAELLGYPRKSRYIALFWDFVQEEVLLHDGTASYLGDQVVWRGFLITK